MNINKFTQKSIEAVKNCEKLAYDHGISSWSRSTCSTAC